MRGRSGAVAAVLLFGVLAVAPSASAQLVFDVMMSGTSTDLTGQMYPFTGTGTATVDIQTGALSLTLTTDAGVTFTGTGTLGVGVTGIAFASGTFNTSFSSGVAVFSGNIDPATGNLAGQLVAGSPNRLGPAPFGFAYTTATVLLTPGTAAATSPRAR